MLPAKARMWPATKPYQPTVHDLHQNGRLFPPNYLHESWMDYLYWDSELEEQPARLPGTAGGRDLRRRIQPESEFRESKCKLMKAK